METSGVTSLKQAFKNWLEANGFGVSVDSYPRSIEAISMPLSTPMSKTTGSWEGVYEYVIGESPKVDVFSVTGRHHFDSVYARFSQLMSKPVQLSVLGIDQQRHQELIDYTLKSGNSTDKGRLYCAYNKYKEFLTWFDLNKGSLGFTEEKGEALDNRVLAAIRTKPFILLAGISGTGKSRMVRQLARGLCPRYKSGSTTEDHPLYNEQKPGNFEIIPVRPNWHDSTELMGYESRIGKPEFIIKPFVEFLVKAWMNPDIPFFLCLDEMNLAPVEQYFAEYLSAIESRKAVNGGGRDYFKTDVVVKIWASETAWDDHGNSVLHNALEKLFAPYKDASGNLDTWASYVREVFTKDGGVSIPQNLVVMGTVNMDETTCSFSRKVLDRAMSFELNDVSDMYAPDKLVGEGDYEFGSIAVAAAKCSLLTGKEAYDANAAVGGKVLEYLKIVNEALEGEKFKIAYRSRNEIMIYCVERTNGGIVGLRQALDEATNLKILSRIEGDDQTFASFDLKDFRKTIVKGLLAIDNPSVQDSDVDDFLKDEAKVKASPCASKLGHMIDELSHGAGVVSYWE